MYSPLRGKRLTEQLSIFIISIGRSNPTCRAISQKTFLRGLGKISLITFARRERRPVPRQRVSHPRHRRGKVPLHTQPVTCRGALRQYPRLNYFATKNHVNVHRGRLTGDTTFSARIANKCSMFRRLLARHILRLTPPNAKHRTRVILTRLT